MAPKNNAGAVPTGHSAPKKTKRATDKGLTTYLHKVHKQIHPPKSEKGYTVSACALEVVNMLVEDLEQRLSKRAFSLAKFEKKSTLSAKHVQTATKMVFPPEMGGMAIGEGSKALTKYLAAA